jgi:hypothetical protein
LAALYNMSTDAVTREIVSDRTSKVAIAYRITMTVLESQALSTQGAQFQRKRSLSDFSRRRVGSVQPRRISELLPPLKPDNPSPAATLTTTLPFSKIAQRTRRMPQMFVSRPGSASEKRIPVS